MQTYISRDNSNVIKGVAILMMVWLHLFQNDRDYWSLFSIQGMTIERILTFGCHPVPFFLIISGYGLSYSYEHSGINIYGQFKKIFRLYVCYWLVLLVFVIFGSVVQSARYPGGLSTIMLNVTGIECTWNFEMWFLLPYSIVTLFAKQIIYFAKWKGVLWSTVMSCVLYLACGYVISRSVATGVDLGVGGVLLICGEFLFPFMLGVWMYEMRNRTFLSASNNYWILLAAGLLFVMKCFVRTQAVDPIYAFLMTVLLVNLKSEKLTVSMIPLGRRSMFMWMIHPFLAIYLFGKVFFALRYPVVIYLAVVAVSYILAIVFEKVNSLIPTKR